LAWFFVKVLRLSLSDIAVYRNRYAQLQHLSESAVAVLNCFKSSPEKRIRVSVIERETGIPRRTIQYALQTLTKKEFIRKLGKKAGTRYQIIF
jgi:Fic family protein